MQALDTVCLKALRVRVTQTVITGSVTAVPTKVTLVPCSHANSVKTDESGTPA